MLPPTPLDQNPISDTYEASRQVGSYGPELAWKIFDAVSRFDRNKVSFFFILFSGRVLLGSPTASLTFPTVNFSAGFLGRHKLLHNFLSFPHNAIRTST
jgi:hypothetical protein